MCGIVAIAGPGASRPRLDAMLATLTHRGPDAEGVWQSDDRQVALGHRRLSIIDLSDLANQPMTSANGRFQLILNGEIYNYRELRAELASYPYRTESDSEVLLAALQAWGTDCFDRLLGMFAFVVWDAATKSLLAVRDRFGVKPLYYAELDGTLLIASEIKALHAAGVPARPDEPAWAGYLAHGSYPEPSRTFWQGVYQLAAGHAMTWAGQELEPWCWYDLAERVGLDEDDRDDEVVRQEYLELLENSVRLRFRADVEVGINLSGGLDSATLLAMVGQVQGAEASVRAFTFVTGDPDYDELPWAQAMLAHTRHRGEVCSLQPDEVPALAASMQHVQDEPYGGLPTLAYAKVFARARELGVKVLLDGQGMDEQWAGYDYYRRSDYQASQPTLQGARDPAVRIETLQEDFCRLARVMEHKSPFPDRLRQLQHRDILTTKIPRALRFNDRVSMIASTELREPFLDHRLVELAFRQPAHRKIRGDTGKAFLREAVHHFFPKGISEAPKRPLQTPQREWLRGPLQAWADGQIETMLAGPQRHWFHADQVRVAWQRYGAGESDNSFYVWQWISLALMQDRFLS